MKQLIYLIIAIFPLLSIGENLTQKTKFLPGGIISLNNDTLSVEIKYESIDKLQNQVKFIDASGRKKTFKPNMVKGFFINRDDGVLIFESRQDIRISAFPSKNGYFVLRLSNDIFPLYYFITNKIVNTGVESKNMLVPHYSIYLDGRWRHFNSGNFKECTRFFSQDKTLVNDINKDRYNFEDFPTIVENYCEFVKEVSN